MNSAQAVRTCLCLPAGSVACLTGIVNVKCSPSASQNAKRGRTQLQLSCVLALSKVKQTNRNLKPTLNQA